MKKSQRYKIEIFLPEQYIDAIREAMNTAGACHVGNYDNCLNYMPVHGFWRPLEGAHPFKGTIREINKGTEYKIETVCDDEHLEAAIAAARKAHPYEEPLINIIPLYDMQS